MRVDGLRIEKSLAGPSSTTAIVLGGATICTFWAGFQSGFILRECLTYSLTFHLYCILPFVSFFIGVHVKCFELFHGQGYVRKLL